MQSILSKYPDSVVEKAKRIKALVSDVDGVLTDGKITYDGNGIETKSFNVKDGLIIKKLIESGIKVGLITGRSSSIVEKRSNELGLDFCYQGSRNKGIQFEEVKSKYDLSDDEIAYLGDDLNDLELLLRAGLGVAPADTMDYIKERVDLVSQKLGGDGVLREVGDLILAAKGEFNQYLNY